MFAAIYLRFEEINDWEAMSVRQNIFGSMISKIDRAASRNYRWL